MAFTDEKKAQEIIDLMRQNAESLDKLANYKLKNNLFVGEFLYNDESLSKQNLYYSISVTTHFVEFETVLIWLRFNKPSVAGSIEGKYKTLLSDAKKTDQKFKDNKDLIDSKIFAGAIKTSELSLSAEEIKQEILYGFNSVILITALQSDAGGLAKELRDTAKCSEMNYYPKTHKKTSKTAVMRGIRL